MIIKKFKTGYTQGVFDMFHIGHLAIINRAADMCEKLIVGVNSDALVQEYKNKTPVIGEEDRTEIIRNLKRVEMAEIVSTLDKLELWHKYHFDAVFIGDDWKGNERWMKTEQELAEVGAQVVYLPHTEGISSTTLRVEIPMRTEDRNTET